MMSSSIDSGYYVDQQLKVSKTTCKKSPTGEHNWKEKGTWPSIERKCKYCKIRTYTK